MSWSRATIATRITNALYMSTAGVGVFSHKQLCQVARVKLVLLSKRLKRTTSFRMAAVMVLICSSAFLSELVD